MMKQSTSFAQVATNLLNVLQGYSKTIRLLLVMFLTLTVSANAWGAEYTITFKSASSDSNSDLGTSPTVSDVVFSGASYVASFSGCSKMYVGTSGIKLGSSKATGTMNFTLATNYQSNIKSIKIVSAKYGSDTGTLTLYSGSTSLKSGISPGTDYTHTFSSPTKVTSLKLATSSKRAYITKIVITTEEAATCTTNPTVSAGSHSNITTTTATVSCSSGITSLGSTGCSITSYGFVYGTTANPTTSNTKVQVGTTYITTGATFSKGLTGLTANTTYYVRPYATNGNGTAYGTQTSFKTLELPKYTVTLDAGSGTCAESVTEPNAGEGVTLPTPTLDCGDWEFAGWKTTSAVTTETTTEPTLIAAGAYSPTSDITLYAVYKRTETSGDAFAGYEKVNEDLDDWSGKYLLSTGTYTATGSYSSNHLPRTTYTPSSEEKNEWEFTLTKVGNVGYSILFPDGSWYLGWKDGTDFVRSTEDPTENIKYLWTPSINGISNVSATTRKIADNGSADFRPYSSPSSGTVYLYKRVGGSSTTYYHSTPDCGSTEPTVCLIHENRYFYSLFF